jgi:polar amino acid transport system substrate-binding protein
MAANIAHRAGLAKVGVVNVSFDALVAGQTDKFDIAMAQISITEERKKVVEFSAPYYNSDIGVIAKKGSGITSANIREKRLGAAVGQTGATFLQDKIKPTTKPSIFNDTDSMNAAVASGQIDAAISDTAIVLAFAKQSAGALDVVGQYKTGERYGALYPKGSANAATINQIIDQLRSDGTLDKLSQTWLGPAFGGDPAKVPYFTTS